MRRLPCGGLFCYEIIQKGPGQRVYFLFAFLALFFGIIFLTAFLAVLTADFAALTTRLVTDFFFDFFAMGFPLAFGFFRFLLRSFFGCLLQSLLTGAVLHAHFSGSLLCFTFPGGGFNASR
jgi:hypothetical protein